MEKPESTNETIVGTGSFSSSQWYRSTSNGSLGATTRSFLLRSETAHVLDEDEGSLVEAWGSLLSEGSLLMVTGGAADVGSWKNM